MKSCLILNPLVSLLEFDSASSQRMWICEIPRANLETPQRFVIPTNILALLQLFDGTKQTSTVIQEFSSDNPSFTSEKLELLVQQFGIANEILISSDSTEQRSGGRGSKPSYLYLKVRLFPARFVSMLSRPITFLFTWKVIFALLPLFLVTQAGFFLIVFPHHRLALDSLTGWQYTELTFVTTTVALIHELGHAAALNRFGFRRADIGWGLYLTYPVFYTDLSDAWRLKRHDRALVDVAGIYAHCICLVLLLGAIFYTQSHLLIDCFVFVDFQIAASLNPFIKMDGYWVVADCLGVADLHQRTVKLIDYAVLKVFRGDLILAHPLADLATRVKKILYMYVCLGGGFLVYLYWIFFSEVAFRLVPSYIPLLTHAWRTQFTNSISMLGELDLAASIFWRGLIIYGFARFLFSTARVPLRWISKARYLSQQNNGIAGSYNGEKY